MASGSITQVQCQQLFSKYRDLHYSLNKATNDLVKKSNRAWGKAALIGKIADIASFIATAVYKVVKGLLVSIKIAFKEIAKILTEEGAKFGVDKIEAKLPESQKLAKRVLTTFSNFDKPSFWAANLYQLQHQKTVDPKQLSKLIADEKKRCEREIRTASQETLKKLEDHMSVYSNLQKFFKKK